MSTTARREREIQELRSKIITQSWKIITEDGWQALSIRKIADAIEYSAPVIYKHFESKEAIIEYFSKSAYCLSAYGGPGGLFPGCAFVEKQYYQPSLQCD